MLNQKGFATFLFLFIILGLSGLIIAGSFYIKNNKLIEKFSDFTTTNSSNITPKPFPSETSVSIVKFSPSPSVTTISNTPFPTPSSQKEVHSNNVYNLEISENISTANVLDMNKVTSQFYSKYADDYDFLAIFPAFSPSYELGGVSSSINIQNNIKGICRDIRKPCFWGTCGSNKLQSLQIFSFKNNNYDQLVNTPEVMGDTLLHEIAHHWGVSLARDLWGDSKIRDGINESCFNRAIPVTKVESDHWAYGLQSPSGAIDPIEDSRPWIDRGNGIYSFDTTLYNQPKKYHPFDLYLMGLLDSSEIKDSYLLLTNIQPIYDTSMPSSEVVVKADSTKVTINDVIKIADQEREPKAANSQKDFRIAFIILTKAEQTPSVNMIKTINELSETFPRQWAYATNNRSIMNK